MRWFSERETPVPIPNTEVKPLRADDSAWATGCESRSPPHLIFKKPLVNSRGFFVCGFCWVGESTFGVRGACSRFFYVRYRYLDAVNGEEVAETTLCSCKRGLLENRLIPYKSTFRYFGGSLLFYCPADLGLGSDFSPVILVAERRDILMVS